MSDPATTQFAPMHRNFSRDPLEGDGGTFAAVSPLIAALAGAKHPPAHYRERLADFATLAHVTVEVDGELAGK